MKIMPLLGTKSSDEGFPSSQNGHCFPGEEYIRNNEKYGKNKNMYNQERPGYKSSYNYKVI